jgi:uncharacterized protein (TIGR03435 family)
LIATGWHSAVTRDGKEDEHFEPHPARHGGESRTQGSRKPEGESDERPTREESATLALLAKSPLQRNCYSSRTERSTNPLGICACTLLALPASFSREEIQNVHSPRLLAGFCALCTIAGGQEKGAPSLAFEAASVRLAGEDSLRFDGPRIQTRAASLIGHAASIREYVLWAYRILPAQLVAPDWLDDVRLDVVAKAAAPVNDQQMSLMLRNLLADRLGLKAHAEEKEMPVYALTPAKGGTKFSESTTEGPRNVERDQGVEVYRRWSMYELLYAFSNTLGRPILDGTGLPGRYDFRIDLASVVMDPQERDKASVLIAVIRGQLGLNIESRKAKVKVLIIDHAEKRPTEN